ncbi:MAG TPA: lipoyl synthase [Candidatus Aquicultor sp.]|jgi:lipoic acid synthetase
MTYYSQDKDEAYRASDRTNNHCSESISRKPAHLKVRLSQGPNYRFVKQMLRTLKLHTVCEEAACPNVYECFEAKTATFLILGDMCTRNCRFCLVDGGKPLPPDPNEPEHVAEAVKQLRLHYVVITSVTRDDLSGGGASIFADTIRAIRKNNPGCGIEVLIPDFAGNWDALALVVDAQPDVLNHNIETVPRLYPAVRPAAHYKRSLTLLKQAKKSGLQGHTKSGIIAGLGETKEELLEVMADLRHHNCDIVTIGQYLSPSKAHYPIARYYSPEEFCELEGLGNDMGFLHVEAAPLVRSSYHAKEQFKQGNPASSSTGS